MDYEGIHPARRPSATAAPKTRATTAATVRDLIAQLQKCPPGAVVWLEGCDCVGEATGEIVNVDDETPLMTAVLLRRKP